MNTKTSSKRNRILLVSPYFPYPAHDGGKVRIFNLIKHLSVDNDIYLLSYIENEGVKCNIGEMQRYCKDVFVVVRNENNRIVEEKLPRSVSFFYTKVMIDELARVVDLVKPDLVQIDFLIMTQYVNHIKDSIPVIYTEHDMSNINFEQSFHDRDLCEKERFIEWTRLISYEKAILNKFNSVIVLTKRDMELLKEFCPGCKIVLVPTGVDVEYYKNTNPNPNKTNNNLIYIGHYKHYPNYDAVEYFVKDIYPIICNSVEDVKFNIVGSGVTENLRRLEKENINIVGEVDDVRYYLNNARVFVAPIRLGGGIKGKILEAMACGIPVVATEEAKSGIDCKPGRDIIVVKDSIEFAIKTVELLRNRKYCDEIADNARKNVELIYDWRKIADNLNSYYSCIISGKLLRAPFQKTESRYANL